VPSMSMKFFVLPCPSLSHPILDRSLAMVRVGL
jgi:hypothetical protein